ncbi:MAG: flagellar biosynthetic protein FliO [Geminicoccaceae bacterium]
MLEYADLSRTIIGLGLVLLLMAAVFWLVRRFGPAEARGRLAAGRRLAVLETLPLDPRTRLVLLRHDESEHLVLVSSQGSASLLTTTGGPPSELDEHP